MEEHLKVKKISLTEFKDMKDTPAVEKIIGSLNGGRFMECHTAFYAATGLWIPELVPVFQKLDAALVTRQLPAQLR